MTNINLSVPFESLVTAIQSLTWSEQKKLLELLEDQIFESQSQEESLFWMTQNKELENQLQKLTEKYESDLICLKNKFQEVQAQLKEAHKYQGELSHRHSKDLYTLQQLHEEDCEVLKEDIKELQTELEEKELSLRKQFMNKLKDCKNLTKENQQLRKRIIELESEVKL